MAAPKRRLHPIPFYPEHFQQRLQEEFGGRMRIRWSVRKGCWCIEQKVGRASLPPFRIEEWDDLYIMARDGYVLAMVVQPGDRMQCPSCFQDIPVPICTSKEAVCTYCLSRDVDARFPTAYYPLGEVLIDHLKTLDVERGAEILDRIRAEDARRELNDERLEAAINREGAAQFGDALRDQIPKAGFPSLVLDSWRH